MTTGIRGFLASGDATQDPQPDPNASLSGRDSVTLMHFLQSDVTAVSSILSQLIDSTQGGIGADHVGRWFLMRSDTPSANDNQAREVIAFDEPTGTYTFDSDLPVATAIGNRYELYEPNGLFSVVTFDQSVREAQKFRLLWVRNGSGSSLTNFGMFVVPIDPGPLLCEVAMGNAGSVSQAVDGITNEEDTPALSNQANFVQSATAKERLQRISTYALAIAASVSPIVLNPADEMQTARSYPVFIRLSFREDEPVALPHRCIFQIFFSDGGTEIGSILIVVDVQGSLDEELILGPDRQLRLGAGARVQAIVRDRSTGTPIPGKTITLQLTSGPGTMVNLDDSTADQTERLTDSSGDPVQTPYFSPTDEADVGLPVVFNAEVN